MRQLLKLKPELAEILLLLLFGDAQASIVEHIALRLAIIPFHQFESQSTRSKDRATSSPFLAHRRGFSLE